MMDACDGEASGNLKVLSVEDGGQPHRLETSESLGRCSHRVLLSVRHAGWW